MECSEVRHRFTFQCGYSSKEQSPRLLEVIHTSECMCIGAWLKIQRLSLLIELIQYIRYNSVEHLSAFQSPKLLGKKQILVAAIKEGLVGLQKK